MKKYITSTVMLVFLCLVVFLSKAYAQQAQQAEVTHYSGTVEVLFKEADDFTGVQEGVMLEAGDTIKTGDSSSAELSFNDDNSNLVRLEEDTEVSLSLSVDEKLEMTTGEVFSTISNLPSGSAFEIRTPTAVSGARGTDWVTKVTEEGTDVEAIDSQPYVRHFESDGTVSKERTVMAPGQMTTVHKFEKPSQFRPIAQARRQEYQALKQEVHKHGGEAIQKRQERPAFDRKNFLDQVQKQRQSSSQGRSEGNKPEGPGSNEDTRMQERKSSLDSQTNSARDNDSEGGRKPLMSLEGQRPSFEQKKESQNQRSSSGLERPLVSGEAGGHRESQGRDRFPEGKNRMPKGERMREQNQGHETNNAEPKARRDNVPASKGQPPSSRQGAGMQGQGTSSNTQGKTPSGKGSAQSGGKGGSRGGAPRGGRPH